MRNLHFFLLAFVLFLFFHSSAFSQHPRTYKTELDNGMTVLINEMPTAPTTAIYIWVKTGSANEGEFLGSGISHCLEHMVFKGTENRSTGTIPAEVKSLGGNINASTSYDYTVYTLNVPQENFEKGLDIVADMVMNATFDPIELEKEKEVIFNEMRMRNDQPAWKLNEKIYAHAYQRHPYRHPIIGYQDLFAQITSENLHQYYKAHYAPNNMILTIAGNIKIEEIMPVIEQAFIDFEVQPYKLRNLPQEQDQIFTRRFEIEFPTEITRLTLAYQSTPIFHEDLYALDVLSMILADGRSSRLHQRLVEQKQLVTGVSATNRTPLEDGLFLINMSLIKHDEQAVLEEIFSELEDIQENGVNKKELERIKQQVASRTIFSLQTSGGRAYQAGVEEAFVGDPDFSFIYADEIQQLTVEDIQRVAQKYFKSSKLTIGVMRPQVNGKELETQKQEMQQEEATIHYLDNGVKLLLKSNNQLPIGSIQVVFNGGTRYLQDDLLGLTSLLSRTWTKGTKKKTALEIAEEVEAKGAAINAFVGRNTLGLQMNFLAKDFDFAVNLIEELIKSPTFPKDEIAREKVNLLSDLVAREDNIVQITMKEVRETMFKTHPYRKDSMGTPETIERITQKDILQFYNKHIDAAHATIAVFGDFDKEEMLTMLEKKFSSIPNQKGEVLIVDEPFPDNKREKTLIMDKEQAMVTLNFRGPNIYNDEQYVLEIIANVLGSSLSGRMFVRIREELGKAYTMGASVSPTLDVGAIHFYALTTHDAVEEVKSIMLEEIQKIKKEPLSTNELDDAKISLITRHASSLETISAQAFTSALDEHYGLGYNNHQFYNDKINQITSNDVLSVAKKYFNLDQSISVITTNEESGLVNE